MNHAWTVIKICRYLSQTRVSDRRVENIKVEVERRSGIDRRFIPNRQELEKINTSNTFLRATLLRQRFLHENDGKRGSKPRKNKHIYVNIKLIKD